MKLNEQERDHIASLLRNEQDYVIDPDYLITKQTEITETMRSIQLDWLINFSHFYGMKRDTLYLANHFLDSFLSRCRIKVPEL